jgi:hypothetical protein
VWRYLKSAFLVGIDVPGLGKIPLNALAAAGFFIVGFGEPAVWLLGLGAEATVVSALAFNKRFQNWVDAKQLQAAEDDSDAKYQALVRTLPPESKTRLNQLQAKCQKVMQVYNNLEADEFMIETNKDALQKFQWVYLKLLVAREHLSDTSIENEKSLAVKISAIERDLAADDESPAVKESKTATLNILRKRIANLRRREDALEEVDSDLMRVEAQVDLVLENATIQGKPQTISTDIGLASDLVGGALFGEEEAIVADLDRNYGKQVQSRAKETER